MGDPNKTNASRTPAAQPAQPAQEPPALHSPSARHSIQAPKGTRDLYPDDANLRRFITEAWRSTSISHGFDEIDGPTFEDANLYKVKSGEGILAEMFGVYSGKSEDDRDAVRADPENPPYALRPEFTPTLARMYAARAAQLPKPTKWFTAGPFFRAERPQRGRLREFLQWNVDFIGLQADRPSEAGSPPVSPTTPAHDPLSEARARADAECIACCINLLRSLGLTSDAVKVRVSDREVIRGLISQTRLHDAPRSDESKTLAFLDRRAKLRADQAAHEAAAVGLDLTLYDLGRESAQGLILARKPSSQVEWRAGGRSGSIEFDYRPLVALMDELHALGVADWVVPDLSIVRGLAYYTGMVFEVIADGERAVAGGGRYDNLIQLFGGPPTPAVGFGMGDVVLTNLLRDKGLLPQGQTLLDRLSQPSPSLRPDALVLTADESLDPIVRRLVADLRRGDRAGGPPLHARHPYKSTRNVGKLLKDAAAMHARFAVIIENQRDATIKDMASGRQHWCPIDAVPAWLRAAVPLAPRP